MELKNKKVLLIGLGILGGGLSMAKYLLSRGAILTITDLRVQATLQPMLNKLTVNRGQKTGKNHPVRYVLGRNPISELKKADMIILNPAVSAFSPLVREIKKLNKEYYNDYTFFLKSLPPTTSLADTCVSLGQATLSPCIVGITGTRGKTTTATWANYLIQGSVLGGNIPEAGLLKILEKKTNCFVLELSSFQLEHLTRKDLSPHIAILTNVYIDHLNRYKTLKRYTDMKKKIYANQRSDDFLILNYDEPITKEVLRDNPKSNLLFTSLKKLPQNKAGLYCLNDTVFFKPSKLETIKVGNLSGFAPHEKNNFMAAALTAYLSGVRWAEIFRKSKTLPQPHLRQEVVFKDKNLTIVNDSAGTSPEATMAVIEKYKDENIYLITGGTNKELMFDGLAKIISKHIDSKQLFLLSGSATDLLVDAFPTSLLRSSEVREYDSLNEIINTVSKEATRGVIIFSPASASFEKFKNEFDRGAKFNKLVAKHFK